MEITFPPTFLWGTATAAHQVEGGNVYNDNWVLEHVPGSPYVESSGDACDHYHRYREDIALLACTLNEVNIGPLITAMMGRAMASARTEPWFEAAARRVGSDASRFTPFLYADPVPGRETILAAHRRAVDTIKAGPGNCTVGL